MAVFPPERRGLTRRPLHLRTRAEGGHVVPDFREPLRRVAFDRGYSRFPETHDHGSCGPFRGGRPRRSSLAEVGRGETLCMRVGRGGFLPRTSAMTAPSFGGWGSGEAAPTQGEWAVSSALGLWPVEHCPGPFCIALLFIWPYYSNGLCLGYPLSLFPTHGDEGITTYQG